MSETKLSRNGEGYYDPTAYDALLKIVKGEKKMENYYRGDLVKCKQNNGLEKDYVILSTHARFCTVLALTDDDTMPFPIKCNGMKYTDPGMLQYMYNTNIMYFIRSLKEEEMDKLMKAVIDSLGWEADSAPVPETHEKEPVTKEDIKNTKVLTDMALELAKITAERDVYKDLYAKLLDSFTD